MTSRISQRMMAQQDLYELFHTYWNLFTAASTYVAVLRHSSQLPEAEKRATEELANLFPRLEELMEAIRVRLQARVR